MIFIWLMCSLQTGQRLKIDIRNDAIQKENDPEAHAALNRMSTLLRDVSSWDILGISRG